MLRRTLTIASLAVIVVAALAGADPSAFAPAGGLRPDEPPPPAPPHLRPESADARALAAELVARSPTAHALVDRLDRSDVVVYLRYRAFTSPTFDGRIALLSSTPQYRYLVIELPCIRWRATGLVMLAHELHHAVEIADAPWVVDARSLAAHYATIGWLAGRDAGRSQFETSGARETAVRVSRELAAETTRTTHERH